MGYFLNLRTYRSVKAFSTSYFSRKDIEVVAGSGCPSTDRKVVNSGKRLRAHVDIDEGNVCSSCILRGNCERAYVMASEGEGGRTVDLMRILLTYGLDPIMVQWKWNLIPFSKCYLIQKGSITARESGIQPKKAELIFQLRQGDWLCPKCNFINFGRNMVCLKCDHKRPKASAQPGHEIRGFSSYHKGSRFVKDEDETSGEPPIRQETQSPNNGTARWRFVEDESKDIDGSKSWDGISGFVDFPIAGGKSELSQNSSKRSKWKAEMLEKSRPHSRGGESRSASLQRSQSLLNVAVMRRWLNGLGMERGCKWRSKPD
ncbi:hypothetical protein CK203_011500 [Vitis vinifera]|uniref:RanBP2-type domain-containing protein n=1 Tax=Vitis vinifera TaxID=29760 RepID=A0A438JU19_VITVI|nr:hypothetical protein CK203_011500 [Vitis vinifera]